MSLFLLVPAVRRYDCQLYGDCLAQAALYNRQMSCRECSRFEAVPEAHEKPFLHEERRVRMEEKKCKVEGCVKKVVAQKLCVSHYDKWRNGDEEVVKAKGGPFKKVRGVHPVNKKALVDRAIKTAKANREAAIAPGSQVVKTIMARVSRNDDLQKAVDVLLAAGVLTQAKLDAAMELVRR